MRLEYDDFQITTNFNTKEFHCKNGVRVPHCYIANVVYVAQQLQTIRNKLGNCTIIINSAYRTIGYNNQVGGSPNSNHTFASAVDIRTHKYTPRELYNKIKELVSNYIIPDGEILLYPTFVHYAPAYNIKYAGHETDYF